MDSNWDMNVQRNQQNPTTPNQMRYPPGNSSLYFVPATPSPSPSQPWHIGAPMPPQSHTPNPWHGANMAPSPASTSNWSQNWSDPSPSSSTSSDREQSSGGVRWRDDETRILLSIWRDHYPSLKNKRNTAKIWVDIAKEVNRELSKAGETMFRKGEQCKRRVKNLEKDYKLVVDRKGRSGNGGRNCEDDFEYWDIFNEILGSDHDITPRNIIEGKGKAAVSHVSKSQTPSPSPSTNSDTLDTSNSPEAIAEAAKATDSDTELELEEAQPLVQKKVNKASKRSKGGSRRQDPADDVSESVFNFLTESQKRDEQFFGQLAEKEHEFQLKLAEQEAKREREREERNQATMVALFKEIAKALKD